MVAVDKVQLRYGDVKFMYWSIDNVESEDVNVGVPSASVVTDIVI